MVLIHPQIGNNKMKLLLNIKREKGSFNIRNFVLCGLAAIGMIPLAGCGGSGTTSSGGSSLAPSALPQAAVTQTTSPIPDQSSSSAALQPHNITSDRRMAVVYEAFYAMDPSWLNPSNQTGPTTGIPIVGGTASKWNYIGSDWTGASHVADQSYGNATVSSFFGPSDSYGRYQSIGRGGECLYFANLILWRSHLITDNRAIYTSWGSIVDCGPATDGQPGDLVFYKNKKNIKDNNHIGVYVYKRDSTHFDVIDSNYLGTAKDSQYSVSPKNPTLLYRSYSEIIGRHTVSSADGWRLFRGNGRWYGPGGH